MKKINNRDSYPSKSEYESGNTKLNNEQLKILKNISAVLNGTGDNYDHLPRVYSAKGLNAALENQIKAKLESELISNAEAERARNLIDILRRSTTGKETILHDSNNT